MNITFKTIKRKNMDGVPCIAPSINEWHVWDIPEAQWTEDVQDAVARAFYIGVTLMKDEYRKVNPSIPQFPEWEQSK
jgi:hypothetical protein